MLNHFAGYTGIAANNKTQFLPFVSGLNKRCKCGGVINYVNWGKAFAGFSANGTAYA